MRRTAITNIALTAPLLAGAGLTLATSLPAIAAGELRPPVVTTGKPQHARGTFALLTGTVNPNGSPTTFYFQFGPTSAYTSRTATGFAGSGNKPVRVGLSASPILLGWHFRIVATNAAGTRFGRDRVNGARSLKPTFTLPAEQTVPYGSVAYVRGQLTGANSAYHKIQLTSSPYPFKEAFEPFGRPSATNALGLFAFRVGKLTRTTQFQVVTLDLLPRFSEIETIHIAVRVSLKVRTSEKPGFVRLFGTVTPAAAGARVEFQLLKHIRPGHSERTEERTTKFITTATTTVKRATKKFSYFSSAVKVRLTGRYRALIVIHSGPYAGAGSRTILLIGTGGRKKR
jgi:hypothetical protein